MIPSTWVIHAEIQRRSSLTAVVVRISSGIQRRNNAWVHTPIVWYGWVIVSRDNNGLHFECIPKFKFVYIWKGAMEVNPFNRTEQNLAIFSIFIIPQLIMWWDEAKPFKYLTTEWETPGFPSTSLYPPVYDTSCPCFVIFCICISLPGNPELCLLMPWADNSTFSHKWQLTKINYIHTHFPQSTKETWHFIFWAVSLQTHEMSLTRTSIFNLHRYI